MQDIFIGLAILAVLAIFAYIVTHHKPPATVSGADLANTLAQAGADSWEAIKRDLPSIVSAEVTQLRGDLSAALARAQKAETDLAAANAAHTLSLAAVAARVAAAVTSSPELPPSPVAPAVAAAQAEDAAAVQALATELTPA